MNINKISWFIGLTFMNYYARHVWALDCLGGHSSGATAGKCSPV